MKPVQAGNLQFHVACVANDKKARKGYQTLFGLQARSDKHSRERFRFFRHIYIYTYMTNEFEFRRNLNAIASVRAFPLRSSLLDLPVIHAKNV